MKKPNSKFIAPLLTLSMVASPAHANILNKGMGALGGWLVKKSASEAPAALDDAAKTAEKAKVGKLPGPVLRGQGAYMGAEKVLTYSKDALAEATGKLFRDLKTRVTDGVYMKTLGRTPEVTLLETKLASPSESIVLLEGARGTGKTQVLIGVQEKINAGAGHVSKALEDSRIIQVSTNDHRMTTLATINDLLNKHIFGPGQIGKESKGKIILHFDDVSPFVSKDASVQPAVRLNELLVEAQRLSGGRIKFVLEGNSFDMALLKKTYGRLVENLTPVSVSEMSHEEAKQVIKAFASSIQAENGTIVSDEAIEKAMTLGRTLYGSIGLPTSANNLISDAVSSKLAVLAANESVAKIIAQKLFKQKMDLDAELDTATQILSQAKTSGQRPPKQALARSQEIPKDLASLNKSIDELTAKLRRVEDLRKQLPEPTVAESLKSFQKRLQANNNVLDDKLRAEHAALKELQTLAPEDLALHVHLEKKIPIEELVVQARRLTKEERLARYRERFVGQPKAVERMIALGERLYNPLRREDRTLGVTIFLGPSGTGKTYLSELAAEIEFGSADKIIKYDMSDFVSKHSIAQINGPDPGLVGLETTKTLVEKARDIGEEGIIFLDEIGREGDASIYDTWLGVMQNARKSNTQSQSARFDRFGIIGATNIGFTGKAGEPVLNANSTLDEIKAALLQKGVSKAFLDRIKTREAFIIFDAVPSDSFGKLLLTDIKKINAHPEITKRLNKFQLTPEAAERLAKAAMNESAEASARAIEGQSDAIRDTLGRVIKTGRHQNPDGAILEIRPGELFDMDLTDDNQLILRLVE